MGRGIRIRKQKRENSGRGLEMFSIPCDLGYCDPMVYWGLLLGAIGAHPFLSLRVVLAFPPLHFGPLSAPHPAHFPSPLYHAPDLPPLHTFSEC